MIFESFDTDSRVIRLDLGGMHDSTLPARLSSLVMVACDCGIDSFEIVNTGCMEGPGRDAALVLIARNPLFADTGSSSRREDCGTDGLWMISRDGGVLCIGDNDSPASYSLYVSPDNDSTGKASVFAHIIACILGFSSFVSFEVRFSVYELLGKVLTGAVRGEKNNWVRLVFTRVENKLSMTIVDRGKGFDPTRDPGVKVGGMAGSGVLRDFGIEATRRIADLLDYESDGNANRIYFYKERETSNAEKTESKEVKMVKFDYMDTGKDSSGFRRISLEGDLDSVGALMLEQLTAELDSDETAGLVLDFKKVSFVSSAGVGILLALVTSMRGGGREVRLENVSGKVITVFRLLNLEEFFGLVPGKERVSAG